MHASRVAGVIVWVFSRITPGDDARKSCALVSDYIVDSSGRAAAHCASFVIYLASLSYNNCEKMTDADYSILEAHVELESYLISSLSVSSTSSVSIILAASLCIFQ